MCDCEFEYGEEIEFSNFPDYNHSVIKRFWGYQPKADIPFSDFDGNCWRYARRPLPDIRPGHPIMVKGTHQWYYARFIRFNEAGQCITDGGNWNKFELLPGYDYTQPPPIEVE